MFCNNETYLFSDQVKFVGLGCKDSLCKQAFGLRGSFSNSLMEILIVVCCSIRYPRPSTTLVISHMSTIFVILLTVNIEYY